MSLRKNKRLYSWLGMILFVGLCFLFLSVLFPRQLLLDNILNDKNTSALTIVYLKDLVQRNPDRVDYLVNLIQQEIKLGHLKSAKKLLQDAEKSKLKTDKFQFLTYQIVRIETFALRKKNPKRIKGEEHLREMLLSMQDLSNLTGLDMVMLGDDALAVNEPAMGIAYYKKALKDSPSLPISFYEKAGEAALYISDYQASADFYLLAVNKNSDIKQKRFYFFKTLDSLKAGKLFDQALDLLPLNKKLINHDNETLLYIVNLALNANNPALAEQYITKALKLKYKD